MTAIASRSSVSPLISDVLIDRGDERTVATLVANEGAQVSEAGLGRVVDRFGESPLVQVPLVQRAALPLSVAERLVHLVSEKLQEYLVTHHDLSPTTAADLILQARERATVDLFSTEDDQLEREQLIQQLAGSGRLTPSLMVRALCTGDVAFFETALAHLARVSVVNARLLIHDGGGLGLQSIYTRAGLPPKLFPIIRIGVDVAHETGFDGEAHDRERHRRRTIERILTQYEEFISDDVDYLLGKLSDLIQAHT
jgi:uncharacterized protein (DUF2336 family)